MDAIDTCLERNARYAEAFSKGALPASPSLKLAVVACMDARMEIGALLGLGEGEAHVIRNAGGVITDDVIRSLAISQLLLGTREILLVHHTDCGMLRFTDAELEEALWKATGRRPSFPLRTFPDLEEDVRHSFARLRASPFVMHKDAIRGFVFDVETGRLREVE